MSITYALFQDSIIYPPRPGDPGGPCHDEHCAHFDCIRMRKDAAALCPTCGQPAGYGNAMHMKAIMHSAWFDTANGGRDRIVEDSGFREVTNEHEACYQARIERDRAEMEAIKAQKEQGGDVLEIEEEFLKDHEPAQTEQEAQAQQDAAASDALAETETQAEALADHAEGQ
jgi:hypothetical protein